MNVKKFKRFKNGIVYALALDDGKLIETTDTFLPYYTKDAIGSKQKPKMLSKYAKQLLEKRYGNK